MNFGKLMDLFGVFSSSQVAHSLPARPFIPAFPAEAYRCTYNKTCALAHGQVRFLNLHFIAEQWKIRSSLVM
jgi:hypothetical protein